jgi:uncharacterized membrane protein
MKLPITTVGSKETCALALSLIALADLSIFFNIPVVRQILVFALLTFLPGFVLIQLLGVTKNPLEKTLFLIGLSVSFLMFVPLGMNFAYQALGIARPISLVPLATTFSLILAVLSVFAYLRGAFDFRVPRGDLRRLTERIFSPPVLVAALILVLGILGGLFMRFYLDSLLSLLSMLSIVAIVVVIALSRRLSPRYYPLFIVVIALALEYSHTLASPNLFGYDVHFELYFADVVRASGVWNPTFVISDVAFGDYYPMLSVTILPNVYSILMNVDNIAVIQLVVPFLFAFVPLGVYRLCETQFKLSGRAAFLAAFFFMSFFGFFDELTRQQIAELFLVLAVLVMMNGRLEPTKSTALLILFMTGMVASHYATSYIVLIYLAVLLIGSALLGGGKKQDESRSILIPTIAVLAACEVFGWYIFTAAGSPYQSLVGVGAYAYNSFVTDLFSTSNSYVAAGVGSGVSRLPFTHALGHYVVIATEVLIAAGMIVVVWWRKTSRMNVAPFLLVATSFCIMLVALTVPALGTALTPYRLYALVLLFLAPCCVLGMAAIVNVASSLVHVKRDPISKLNKVVPAAKPLTCVLLICVLVPYFLFSYNFIFELTENPQNYAFLPSPTQAARTLEYSDNQSWSYLAQTPIPITSSAASEWLSSTMSTNSSVYTDNPSGAEVVAYGHISPDLVNILDLTHQNQSLKNAYFYLGAANVQQQTVDLTVNGTEQQLPISSLPVLNGANLIYSNGLSEIRYR